MGLPLKVATACFLRRNEETLFIDYTNYPHPIHEGTYSPPGGKVKNENLESGAIREVLEETNIKINSLVYRGRVLFLNERRTIKGKSMQANWEVYFYDVFDFDDSQARAKEGALAWVKNESVPSLPLHEGDRIIWSWLKEYREFEAEIEHEGERLARAEIKYHKS